MRLVGTHPHRLDLGELLELLGGHWVGDLHLMGTDLDWFAFDYRPIGPAHVHGMFEGGTVGNLFTSFFLARHEGRSVLMARNGGLLNGIYRTSYFLMTEASVAADGRRDYRFVDALGGADIMWIDLSFQGDALEFRSYTSRFGLAGEPSLHMRFRGKRLQRELADQAAAEVGFPARVPQLDLPEGLPVPDWGDEPWVTSASYMTQAEGLDLVALGRAAGDPLRVDQMPHLAELELTLERGPEVAGQPLQVYLSREALTDADGRLRSLAGYLRPDLGNGILLFPEVSAGADGMTFAYLHPGRYHLTVTADLDGDGYPSAGDVTSPSRVVEVRPGGRHAVHVDDVEVRNR